MSRKRKKVSVDPKENRATVGLLDFSKISEDGIGDACGKFFRLPNLSCLHPEVFAGFGREGVSESPFYLTKSFQSLFNLFQSKVKEEWKREPRKFAKRPILVQGCHGVGKSTNVYALASWIYANALQVFDDETLYLLYIPTNNLVNMSQDQENAFFFYILNMFYCLNQDLLENEEEEYQLSKWEKVGTIRFNNSSRYKAGDDVDKDIMEMTNLLMGFMLDRCVAFIVDDSNYLFEKTSNSGLERKTKYFLKNFLSPRKYRNFTTVISGTSRSQYRQYVIDLRHQGSNDFQEIWIHPIERNELHFFISREGLEENSVYSKLKIDTTNVETKKKDLDFLAEVTGCVPQYLFYLATKSNNMNKDWKDDTVLRELMREIDNKCKSLLEKTRIRDEPESFEAFVNSILFETAFEDPRMVNVIDFGLVREKPGDEGDRFLAVNSYALSGLMIVAYRNLVRLPSLQRENYGSRSIEGVAFEKSLIAVLGSGFVITLQNICECGGERPNIPPFCVKAYVPISGISVGTLNCGVVSPGHCSMLVPKLSNFRYMDFFIIDRTKEAMNGIKNCTILCFQATVGDMYEHIYKKGKLKVFGEIGKFMVNKERLGKNEYDQENGSLLLKLLERVFRGGPQNIQFKVVKVEGVKDGFHALRVHIKIGQGPWELMPNFHIVYLVKKEEISRLDEICVTNCCYMDWNAILKDFPKFFRMPNC